VSIFVGNLPFRAEQEDVIELFSPFGEVANCSLPLERDTGRKRGFAFVEMADEAVEASAIESLQGAELMGRPLRINKAEPRGSAPREAAAAMAAAVNQLKIDLLELKVGKIVVMAMHHKILVALIKVAVEEEEELRLKVETTLLQIMVVQNLKDFVACC